MAKGSKIEIAIAEMSVSMKGMAGDISEIKAQLRVMDENFARKDEVEKNAAAIVELRNALQTIEIKYAVLKSDFRNWGIVGGVIVTLVAAVISALQIHL